jgi:hypothetical protein
MKSLRPIVAIAAIIVIGIMVAFAAPQTPQPAKASAASAIVKTEVPAANFDATPAIVTNQTEQASVVAVDRINATDQIGIVREVTFSPPDIDRAITRSTRELLKTSGPTRSSHNSNRYLGKKVPITRLALTLDKQIDRRE